MNALELIRNEWLEGFLRVSESPALKKISNGEANLEHIKAILRETRHLAKFYPQALCTFGARLNETQRPTLSKILLDAQAALKREAELEKVTLSLDPNAALWNEVRPLPATTELVGYQYYLLQHNGATSFAAYIIHNKLLPLLSEAYFEAQLKKNDIPESLISLIFNSPNSGCSGPELTEEYVAGLIPSQNDLIEVTEAARNSIVLYGKHLNAAIASACFTQTNGDAV